MRLIVSPVCVTTDQGLPRQIRWEDKLYTVEHITDEWIWQGKWWTDSDLRGECRHYYVVHASSRRIGVRESTRPYNVSTVGPSDTCRATSSWQRPKLHSHKLPYDAEEHTPALVTLEVWENSGSWTLSRIWD